MAARREGGTGTVSIPEGGPHTISAGTVQYMHGGITAGANGFYVPVDGIYMVSGSIRLDLTPPHEFQLRIVVGGVGTVIDQSGWETRYLATATTVQIAAGQDIFLQVWNNGTDPVDMLDGIGAPHLAVALIART